MSMKSIFYTGNGTTPVDSGLPHVGRFFGIEQKGDLRFFQYDGNGEQDPTGTLGFRPNTGNTIGNGFGSFLHVVGGGDGIILAIKPNGDLTFFQYTGQGEQDPTGANGFVGNNPGNVIGNGFQNFRHLFGGSTDHGGRGHILFAVNENGDLLFFRYDGNGEQDPSGTLGFERPNQGNQIGRGF